MGYPIHTIAAAAMTTIRRLTPEVLCAAAQSAAAQHIPLAEANHHEPGTDLWALFNQAYQAHDPHVPAQRRQPPFMHSLEREAA